MIQQLNEFINYSYDDHPLYSQFMMKVDKLELSDEDLKNLDQEIKKAIDESVTPGFKLLLGFMKKLKKMQIRIMEYGLNQVEMNITN